MNAWKLAEKAQDRAYFQAESVAILMGHMTNAIIDLQSGETKASAIATLQRGLDLIAERQAPMRALADAIAMSAGTAKTEGLGSEGPPARAEGIAQGRD